MTFAALQPLADRSALFTALRQDALRVATEELGDHRWDVVVSAKTLTFTSNTDPSRSLTTTAHLIASIAPGPRSLLWGWAHPQGEAQGIAGRLRAFGEERGIRELAEPEVPFPADAAGDEDWITEAAHTVAGAAVEITGFSPYYSAPLGGGTRAVFLLEAPLPAPTVASTVIVLPRILSGLALPDARTAVWDLARLAGWNLTWTDEAFSGATIVDQTGSVTFGFDEQARISRIQSSLQQA